MFEISPTKGGTWKQTVLYSFGGGPDAANPLPAALIRDKSGSLYGVAEFGGSLNSGAILKLAFTGTEWKETILYSFGSGSEGGHPTGHLVMDHAGNLYGTTYDYLGRGNIYELSPTGKNWALQIVYEDAAIKGLTVDGAGNLYGIAGSTVFKVAPGGNGWTRTDLHTFAGTQSDGRAPSGKLALDQAGSLYGVTYSGGAAEQGTVYRLSAASPGLWNEEILYSFRGGSDGANPVAGIALDADGNIYGTTTAGGSSGAGTVFELASAGNLEYQHTVLWSFESKDEAFRQAVTGEPARFTKWPVCIRSRRETGPAGRART